MMVKEVCDAIIMFLCRPRLDHFTNFIYTVMLLAGR